MKKNIYHLQKNDPGAGFVSGVRLKHTRRLSSPPFPPFDMSLRKGSALLAKRLHWSLSSTLRVTSFTHSPHRTESHLNQNKLLHSPDTQDTRSGVSGPQILSTIFLWMLKLESSHFCESNHSMCLIFIHFHDLFFKNFWGFLSHSLYVKLTFSKETVTYRC